MYSEDDLSSAVAAGVLTEASAEAFRAHVEQRQRSSAVDEEHFRLVTGFNDIFVVIACVLLLASLAGIGASYASHIGSAAVAVAAWLLAEFFTRRRRMALPSIVLLLAFTGAVFATILLVVGTNDPVAYAIASAVAALAAWLHWRRFRVPITIAAGVAAAVGCAFGLFLWVAPNAGIWLNLLSLIAGWNIAAFAQIGERHASTVRCDSPHPLMHRTESVDYGIVIEGEMTLVLDEGEIILRPGSVVIQRGTNHAWANRSGRPCRMLFVLISGRYVPSIAAALADR